MQDNSFNISTRQDENRCQFFTCSFFESDNLLTLEDASEISQWQKMDKKCILLLQSLATEQLKHDFHNNSALQNLDITNSIHFKFFLNTLEMFSHSIGIIKLENYAYRIKNYGQYEKLLNQMPRALDNGSFINFQTYCATLENEVSKFMKKKIESMTKQGSYDEYFLQLYKEYAFNAAQYHIILRKLFKEISKVAVIMQKNNKICKDNNVNPDSMIYIEGIIDPINRKPNPNGLKKLLLEFDFTIRRFEEARIFVTIKIFEFFMKENPDHTPNIDIKSDDISRIYPISGITSIVSTQNKPFGGEIIHHQKYYSESSALSSQSNLDTKKKLKLNESFFEKSSQTELDTEREKFLYSRRLSQHGEKSKIMSDKALTKTSAKRFSCITPILKNKENTDYHRFGTDLTNKSNFHLSNPTDLITSLNTKKNSQIKSSNYKQNINWGSFENKENECVLFRKKESNSQNPHDSQLKELFQENKFYKSKPANPSVMLKFR